MKNTLVTSNLRALVGAFASAQSPEQRASALSSFASGVADAMDAVAGQISGLGEPYRNAVSNSSAILIDPSHLDPSPLAKSVYPMAPSQVISLAANSISPGSTCIRLSNTTGGHITLTAAPTIADGLPQQMVLLYNIGTKNIVLQDQGTLAGSNLRLGATTRTLTPRRSIALLYSNDIGDWIEQYYSAVL